MKAWKTEIVEDIRKAADGQCIVSLREIAGARGIRHIGAQDTRDILGAARKLLPGFRPVRMMRTENDSLFQSLCFVEDGVEFDDGRALEG